MMFKPRKLKRSRSKTAHIIVEDLSPELVPITGTSRFAVLVYNLLSPEECANLLRRAEDEGFDDALVQDGEGKQVLRRDVRSCGRCIIDDAGLADALYVRVANALRGTESEKKLLKAPWISNPKKNGSSRSSSSTLSGAAGGGDVTAVGLNERMRFVKYEPGNFFAPHRDLCYTRPPSAGPRAGETSYVTVQLYLNEKFKGGTTRFLNGNRYHDVKPRTGSALIFDHDLLHQGSEVTSGVKYSVRTDVMYSAAIAPSPSSSAASSGATTTSLTAGVPPSTAPPQRLPSDGSRSAAGSSVSGRISESSEEEAGGEGDEEYDPSHMEFLRKLSE